MMSLATNRRIPTKLEKRVFTRPPNPPSKQPVTPRYLHSKKTNSNKVSGPTANATPFPALKRRSFKKDIPEILKNEIKKTSDNQHALKPDNVSVESSMPEMHSFKVISDISEISSPGIRSNIGKPVSKYAAEQYEKSSPHSYSIPYNPNQFSSNVQPVKQKPTENKKLVVEEIQKNLKKWRIQRDTKAKENVNTHLDIQNVTSDKTPLICTEMNKFNPEEKSIDDRMTNVNEEPNVNNYKKISESHDFSVQVNLNEDNHDTSNAAKNLQTITLVYEKTAISKDCNYNTDSHNEKTIKNDSSNPSNLKNEKTDFRPTNNEISSIGTDKKSNSNPSNLKNEKTDFRPTNINEISNIGTDKKNSSNPSHLKNEKTDFRPTNINEISNIGTDKKTKKKNDVHNIEHSRSESEVIQNSVIQSSGDVLDSMTKNHKKCLYALVDSYLNKTKTNPNKSMENFMKYMLSNLGPSNTEEQRPSSMSKENSMHVQIDTLEEDKSKTHDNIDDTDFKQDENKSDNQCSLEKKVGENSLLGKIQSKEKYLKKLSTEKFKSKYLEESHNKEANRTFLANSNSTIPDVTKENSVLSKKDKFKQLTLISSKQNENMYIHINYQSHTGPLGKSKLTIHKESHIDIRPQLTKHTFTTATCMPRVHSSKPNISTHYLVHLNEGGCKEIDPDAEEIPQDSFSFPNTGILSYKKNRLDNIIRALIRHVKMNMRLGNKMTSTVAEKLLALQEHLCKYYSNQPGGSLDFNSQSSHSRQIITLIILEIDNPHRPNLDVRTNQNLKLILQQVMESINGPPHAHTVSLVGQTEPTNCKETKASVKNISHSRTSSHRPPENNNANTNTVPTILSSKVFSKLPETPCVPVPTVPSSKVLSKQPDSPCIPVSTILSSKMLSKLPDTPCIPVHTVPSLKVVNKQPRIKIRKSFGMHKNYLSKKIRQSLDTKLCKLTENKLNSFVSHWGKSLNIHEQTKKQIETSCVADDLKEGCPDSEPTVSDEIIYESDWVTPSSTSSDHPTHSNETPDKSVHIIEKTNHAEVQIRFQDKENTNNKEHYRISVRTDEDSVIRGVRPQLPCTILEDNLRNRYVLTMKETQYNNVTYDVDSSKQYQVQKNAENNLVLALDLQTSGNNMNSIYSKLDNVIADKTGKTSRTVKCITKKSRSNFTNTDKTYTDSIRGSSGHASYQVPTDTMFKENECGDSNTSNNHSKYLNRNSPNLDRNSPNLDRNSPNLKRDVKVVSRKDDRKYVTSSEESSQTKTGKTTIGVNTDASLLDSLIKNLQPTDTEDSYACDLSMCFSTDNELSEGEIGFFAFHSQSSRICHARKQYSDCKSPLNSSDCSGGGGNLRKSRMLELQHFTDIFLTK